jgi:hypothetical protein
MAGLSYHQVISFFRLIYGVKVTKYFIKTVIEEAGIRAKQLNGRYDAMARVHFRIIEIDEVFQGQKNCYLAVVDKDSHYTLLLDRIENRSIETIAAMLEPLSDCLDMLELVITDALAAYKSVIPGTFAGVVHVLCHVHAHRIFLKEGEEYHRAARKARTSVRDARARLERLQHARSVKKKRLKRLAAAWKIAFNVRRLFCQQRSWRRRAGDKSRSQQRHILNKQVHSLKTRRDELNAAVTTIESKIQRLREDITSLEQDARSKKQISLQTGRLVSRFHKLLNCPPDRFETELVRYKEMLARSQYPIAKRIAKFIKNNPNVYATNLPKAKIDCPLNLVNTNTVEGSFGLTRPILNMAKHFHDSVVSKAFLGVFRLKQNMSSPFTGPNKERSPLERAGVHSRFSSYLDAIFPLPGNEERIKMQARDRMDRQIGSNEDEFRENLARFSQISGNPAVKSG